MPDEDGYLGRAVKSFEKIALRAISTGNFGWLAVTIIIVVCIYKLESPDLKEVILKAIPTIGLLGYPISVISVIICVRTLRWREQFYKSEMDRMAETRNAAIQARLELPMESSVKKESR